MSNEILSDLFLQCGGIFMFYTWAFASMSPVSTGLSVGCKRNAYVYILKLHTPILIQLGPP